MAYSIPETIHSHATAGERLLFQTLKTYLPEDCLVYYEPEINGKRPDFVIIGPHLGIIVLEVKDYTKGTLHSVNKDEWTILPSSGGIKKVKNPLLQARQYAFHLADLLKKNKDLVQLEGKHFGNLKFPYGFGTVFTRLKQEDFVRNNLFDVIEPQFVFCRDEIDAEEDGFSQENLFDKLQGMLPYRKERCLTEQEIQTIRYHLFPEVRISAEVCQPVIYQDQLLLSLQNIKTMDLHQENLAKQLGDKHRLIRGVAGSGKTLVLASRAKLLAKQHPNWKILVLCFGSPLAAQLRSMMEQRVSEADDLLVLNGMQAPSENLAQIEVSHFHAWLWKEFKIKDDQIQTIIEKYEQQQTGLPKYDAILIDEGQDFEPDWLKLVSCVLNEETKCLLLVEDRAQNIFKRKISLNQNIGLDFRGRSKVLTINYRNTAQIVQFAWDFFKSHSQANMVVKTTSTDGIEILPPQSTKRKGPEPVIQRFSHIREEMAFVSAKILELHEKENIPFSEMVILYRVKEFKGSSYIHVIREQLSCSNIPRYWVTENAQTKRHFNRNEESVKISTLDSIKGLDFHVVFIVNIENIPYYREENQEREAALLYIGMTRSLKWLFLTYSGDSLFTRYLDESAQLKKG